jgi:hypothetical protein
MFHSSIMSNVLIMAVAIAMILFSGCDFHALFLCRPDSLCLTLSHAFPRLNGPIETFDTDLACACTYTGFAEEAPGDRLPSPPFWYPSCETVGLSLPECLSRCNKRGYLKAGVCCWNSWRLDTLLLRIRSLWCSTEHVK